MAIIDDIVHPTLPSSGLGCFCGYLARKERSSSSNSLDKCYYQCGAPNGIPRCRFMVEEETLMVILHLIRFEQDRNLGLFLNALTKLDVRMKVVEQSTGETNNPPPMADQGGLGLDQTPSKEKALFEECQCPKCGAVYMSETRTEDALQQRRTPPREVLHSVVFPEPNTAPAEVPNLDDDADTIVHIDSDSIPSHWSHDSPLSIGNGDVHSGPCPSHLTTHDSMSLNAQDYDSSDDCETNS